MVTAYIYIDEPWPTDLLHAHPHEGRDDVAVQYVARLHTDPESDVSGEGVLREAVPRPPYETTPKRFREVRPFHIMMQ